MIFMLPNLLMIKAKQYTAIKRLGALIDHEKKFFFTTIMYIIISFHSLQKAVAHSRHHCTVLYNNRIFSHNVIL